MLADLVSAMPGVSKAGALRGVGLPDRGIGYLRPLDRAIAAGLIIVEHATPTLCRLFASERDRQVWHLRDELLHSSPTADRASVIDAEIEALRAEAAKDFAVDAL